MSMTYKIIRTMVEFQNLKVEPIWTILDVPDKVKTDTALWSIFTSLVTFWILGDTIFESIDKKLAS